MKTKRWKTKIYTGLRAKGIHAFHCWLCGKKLIEKEATVDHVIPKSMGGENTETNYRMACAKCNRKKGSKIISRKAKPKRNWNAAQRGY